ncbi:hypothetical protein NFI96_021887 [Prochilodus magdalenae]|nr:hypothetical protein NFI96_021887 [Prochilodus magdalenae]
MSPALWVCLLCLQGYLLTHALDCADGGRDCAGREVSEVSEVKVRVRRHPDSDRERGGHLDQASLPGTFSAKGFPNTLIQADRSRRHLNSNKKKHVTRKSRVGTYSLLKHNLSNPLQWSTDTAINPLPGSLLQVVRARRNAGAATPHMPPLKLNPSNAEDKPGTTMMAYLQPWV